MFFIEIFSRNSDYSGSVIFEKNTLRKATLPTGILGYIKIRITTVEPSHYGINVLLTLIPSVVQTNCPEITEPIDVHYQDMKQTNNCFEFNHIDLYKDLIISKTVCNVQSSQKLAPRVFPLLPCCEGNLHFLKDFHFQHSDPKNSDYVQLYKILVENKYCSAPLSNDVGKISTLFGIRLEPDAKLQSQKPLKFLFFIGTN